MGLPVKILKNHDVSCPNCGRSSCVRVKGYYEHRDPKLWNCHCEGCGTSFKPRKLSGGVLLMTGRNTSIAKSRLGEMRFPPRDPEPPAEVKVYHLPVEEIVKKYGPPRMQLRRNNDGAIDYQSIAAAIRTSAGQVEAADLLGLKLEDLKRYIRYYKTQPRYGLAIKEKEADEAMGPEDNANINMDNVTGGDNELTSQSSPEPERTKTALERARELLPKEKLVELKEAGKSDNEIMSEFGIVNNYYYAIKKEYGLAGRNNQAPAQGKVKSGCADSRLTVARAVEMREEIIEDLDDLNRIMDLAVNDCTTPPSERVIKLLTWHRDQYKQALDRIDQAFSSTEVVL